MRFEPKQIHQEIEQGFAWPVYWIYGPERLQTREIVARFRDIVSRKNPWAEEKIDGATVSGADVVAAANSVPFGGGARMVTVSDAHLLKGVEAIAQLFGPRGRIDQLSSICLLVAKDLDARKKFSKQLIERAAVVSCDLVPEESREKWVLHLASLHGIKSSDLPIHALVRSEPWSLESVESELRKWASAEEVEKGLGSHVLVEGSEVHLNAERFLESFLERRNKKLALGWVRVIGSRPEDALPLVGLLSWNVRMLALIAAKSRSLRLAPFLEGKLLRSLRCWTLPEIQDLQTDLAQLDFALKQTPQEPLALWGVLVSKFCRD